MTEFKPYPKYKDSGVEWIGEIPRDWNLVKYKRIFQIHNGHGFPNHLQGQEESDRPFLKVSDISFRGKYVEKATNYVSNLMIRKNKWDEIPVNSILTAKIGEALRKNHRKINSVPCLIDNNMMALTSFKEFDLNFLFYTLSVVDFDWYSNPGAVPSLNNRYLREDYLTIPPTVEQKGISNFVNRKTSQIDSLIADKERLIELLEEKRQAVITETVTKGLNPNVKMKDSGIEWIGEIPEHWEVIKLKYLFNIKNGGTPKSNVQKYWNGDIVWITPQDLSLNGYEFSDSIRKISEQGLLNSSTTLIKKESIAISTRAPIGNMKISNIEYTTNQGCKSLEKNRENVMERYFFYFLQSRKNVLQSLGQGTTFLELSNNNLKEFVVPLPLKYEQQKIVEQILIYNSNIDLIIEDINKQIIKLKQYRESLIYEAVTGKIDLRDYEVEHTEK